LFSLSFYLGGYTTFFSDNKYTFQTTTICDFKNVFINKKCLLKQSLQKKALIMQRTVIKGIVRFDRRNKVTDYLFTDKNIKTNDYA